MLDIKPEKNSNQRLEQMMSQLENNSGENFKLGIILLSVFIVVLLVIFGTYMFRSKKSLNQVTSTNNQLVNEETNTDQQNNKVISPKINTVIDTDNDGLSDSDEMTTYKTDPNKVDTDGDGLSDREEIMVYKTDPLKADTDGDGKSDGEEIKSRHNPLDSNPDAEWPPLPINLSTKK